MTVVVLLVGVFLISVNADLQDLIYQDVEGVVIRVNEPVDTTTLVCDATCNFTQDQANQIFIRRDGTNSPSASIDMNNTNLTNLNAIQSNIVNANCVNSYYEVAFSDASSLPNGFLPLTSAGMTTSLLRGYPALSDIEVRQITISSQSISECIGTDSTVSFNNSCKVGIVFNQSGVRVNWGNITFNREFQKTVNTSVNLSYGDQMTVLAYGSVAGNISSVVISNLLVQFGVWKRC